MSKSRVDEEVLLRLPRYECFMLSMILDDYAEERAGADQKSFLTYLKEDLKPRINEAGESSASSPNDIVGKQRSTTYTLGATDLRIISSALSLWVLMVADKESRENIDRARELEMIFTQSQRLYPKESNDAG